MSVREPYADFTLLADGKNAFPVIMREIGNAKSSLHINMFIWRDDEIGRLVAQAVLAAAERGVRVYLSIDRYGVVLEKAEECKRSFFHKIQSIAERFKIWGLSRIYPMSGTPRRARDEVTPLYEQIMHHPNITVSADVFKADHSKFYVIDDRILILGGINIEDKENGKDMQGRVYSDLMVRIEGEEHVSAFYKKLREGEETDGPYSFGVNVKEQRGKKTLFEMEEYYLNLIRSAKRELCIVMAYFSPLPRFMRQIERACARGVRVTVVIPKDANFQNDLNRKTVRRLLKRTNGRLALYLSPKMLHTKLVASEGEVSFGSTNITQKAFSQLSELNLCMRREESAFLNSVDAYVHDRIAESQRIRDYRKITYRRSIAFLEGFVV